MVVDQELADEPCIAPVDEIYLISREFDPGLSGEPQVLASLFIGALSTLNTIGDA